MDKELKKILAIPEETNEIEFKRLGDANNKSGVIKKIVETIAAIANTDGGDIILGISDPEKTNGVTAKRIFGIEENQDNYDSIFHQIKETMSPPITNYKIHEMSDGKGKTVVRIHIPKATDQFHAVTNEVWIRLKKSNRKLNPHELIDFSYAKGFKRAEEELVNIDFDLLQTKHFDAWKQSKEKDLANKDIKDILFRTGLAKKDDDGNLKPTRAAVLLFAEHPAYLMDTKCAIRVMQIQGDSEEFGEVPNYIEKPKTFSGPIVDQIQKTHEYVLNSLKDGIELKSGFVNKYKIPERALKEAITNAVIHRDYHTKRDIEIRIFHNRVEVLSPGLFPYNITTKNIGVEMAVNKRNQQIVKHLLEFPEELNFDLLEGVQAMRSDMHKNNLYPPVFITYPDLDNAVKVILLNEKQPDEWEKIKAYLEKEGTITNEKARDITGIAQRGDMSNKLTGWVQRGLLIKLSQGKSKRYTYYALPMRKTL